MNKCHLAFVALAVTAGCASGSGTTSNTAPPVTHVASSHVTMSFRPAANAKKVIVSVDGQQTTPLAITAAPQTATLPNNTAVSISCGTQSGGSASGATVSSGTAQTCTIATLLPPGQYDISVQQLDFFNTLIADLNQFITLANGTDFFGNFFGSSPTPAPSPSAS
jgi:hypothetical protein